MSALTVNTPFVLGECGCVLEAGDNGRPLFVPCAAHNVPTTCPVTVWKGRIAGKVRCGRRALADGRCVLHPTPEASK